MNNWLTKFPRLNELYERTSSHCSNSDDVLSRYIRWGESELLVQKGAELLENNLARLDSKAWEDLIVKVLPYSCSKDKSRGWHQFWEHMNESRGYVLLADRGYSKIRFIECGKGQSAELIGETPTSRAILEVKTINRSDDDLKPNSSVLILHSDVPVSVPVKLQEKLRKTIEKARGQIESTLKNIPPVEKKIVLLIINRDFLCSPITMKLLEEKLEQQDLEVICQVGDS
jgi:hypothetical protein